MPKVVNLSNAQEVALVKRLDAGRPDKLRFGQMPKPDRPRQDIATAAAAEGSTRERIVEATVELMAEIGIDRVRTRAIAERAGVNPALVHYHFGSIAALVMEAAEYALLQELGPSIDVFVSAATVQEGITAMLEWIEQRGQRTPGATILAEAMVKATRDPAFRRWTKQASRRFRAIILERLEDRTCQPRDRPRAGHRSDGCSTRGGARRTSVPPPGRPQARRQTNRRADRPDARNPGPRVLAETRRYETAVTRRAAAGWWRSRVQLPAERLPSSEDNKLPPIPACAASRLMPPARIELAHAV